MISVVAMSHLIGISASARQWPCASYSAVLSKIIDQPSYGVPLIVGPRDARPVVRCTLAPVSGFTEQPWNAWQFNMASMETIAELKANNVEADDSPRRCTRHLTIRIPRYSKHLSIRTHPLLLTGIGETLVQLRDSPGVR